MTENSTTFEIGLLVRGLIAPLDPNAGIGATMPPAGAGNVAVLPRIEPRQFTDDGFMLATIISFGGRPPDAPASSEYSSEATQIPALFSSPR